VVDQQRAAKAPARLAVDERITRRNQRLAVAVVEADRRRLAPQRHRNAELLGPGKIALAEERGRLVDRALLEAIAVLVLEPRKAEDLRRRVRREVARHTLPAAILLRV